MHPYPACLLTRHGALDLVLDALNAVLVVQTLNVSAIGKCGAGTGLLLEQAGLLLLEQTGLLLAQTVLGTGKGGGAG